MARYAYVNGRYVPHGEAAVHIEDRGYQFADGVYEVVPIQNGKMIDEEPHLDRLDYSLRELRIAWPVSRAALKLILREMLRRNGLTDGLLYLQVTRGVAPRDHKFPKSAKPALVVTTKRLKPPAPAMVENGVRVISVPDIRWARCDIKSVSLLPNILAKQEAVEAGAFEAWQVDEDGYVTEGTSTNAWIVTRDGVIVTRKANHDILNGITRQAVLRLTNTAGVSFEERSFTLDEAKAASEAFLTSSSGHVLPITRIDDSLVGSGKPGPVTRRLRDVYLDYVTA
jgi:D-alanine transaminase